MRKAFLLAALGLLTVSRAAPANILVEPTFAEKMAKSDLVVIATATSIDCRRPRGVGSTATLSVVHRLKGESPEVVEVSTYSPISEHNLRCLTPGGTYAMFLIRAPSGMLHSVWGMYGIVRVGGPPNQIRVVPARE